MKKKLSQRVCQYFKNVDMIGLISATWTSVSRSCLHYIWRVLKEPFMKTHLFDGTQSFHCQVWDIAPGSLKPHYAIQKQCSYILHFVDCASCNDSCLNDQRDAQIHFYVFIFIYNSLHVSSILCSLSGETNCINTTSGNSHSVLVAESCAGWE